MRKYRRQSGIDESKLTDADRVALDARPKKGFVPKKCNCSWTCRCWYRGVLLAPQKIIYWKHSE